MNKYKKCDNCEHVSKFSRDFPCNMCNVIALDKFEPKSAAGESPNNGIELTSAPQSAGSVKYEIALCVFQDYKAFCDECESQYVSFPNFCKKRIDVGA